MDDNLKSIISSNSKLIIVAITVLIIIVGIGLVASGSVQIAGINGTFSSQNPSKLSGEVIYYSVDDNGKADEIKIKLKGSNLPEGQKNYFIIIGNINGTPADDLWFEAPVGSKLVNGMIITVPLFRDYDYDSFTIYLYDKPMFDGNNNTVNRQPITNITIKNPAYK